ncbi:succinate dehydrogenase flavoprotein subunit [Escherichia coli]|nr:succinate dehydrogenase flavoprotein subunit [Escherichia coli]
MMGGIPTKVTGQALTVNEKGDDVVVPGLFAVGEFACVVVPGRGRVGGHCFACVVAVCRVGGLASARWGGGGGGGGWGGGGEWSW